MNKKVLFISIAAVLGVVGFLLLTQPAEETSGVPSDHQYSQGSSGVVLTEYGDFQCPGCRAYYPVIKQIKEEFRDTVTFQYRHLPLETLHVNARAASRASEAAHLQGKFWEMHDRLYETQDTWKDGGDPLSIFTSFASDLGLDTAKFAEDYRSTTVNSIINADIAEFKKTGAELSTPTFFLDGKKIEEPQASPEYFQALLSEAINARTGASEITETPTEATEPAAE